jgi:hypothetical protein
METRLYSDCGSAQSGVEPSTTRLGIEAIVAFPIESVVTRVIGWNRWYKPCMENPESV